MGKVSPMPSSDGGKYSVLMQTQNKPIHKPAKDILDKGHRKGNVKARMSVSYSTKDTESSHKHKNRRSDEDDSGKPSRKSGGSVGSSNSSGGSGSDTEIRHRKHKSARNAKNKNRQDNIISRIRDRVAESNVFVEHDYRPPHIICIKITLLAVLPFAILLIWDTLSVEVFQRPNLSTINFPGFILIFQFIAVFMALYGFCVQYVTAGAMDRYVTLGKISLLSNYILFFWRAWNEFHYDKYRGQLKGYIPLARWHPKPATQSEHSLDFG